jgi:hypothetical protein
MLAALYNAQAHIVTARRWPGAPPLSPFDKDGNAADDKRNRAEYGEGDEGSKCHVNTAAKSGNGLSIIWNRESGLR